MLPSLFRLCSLGYRLSCWLCVLREGDKSWSACLEPFPLWLSLPVLFFFTLICSVTNIGYSWLSSSGSSSSSSSQDYVAIQCTSEQSSSLGISNPINTFLFLAKDSVYTLTILSNLMGHRSGFSFFRQQGLRDSTTSSAPVLAYISISSPLYQLLTAKGLPVTISFLSSVKFLAQMRLCWFSTLLNEKSRVSRVLKLPAASLSVCIPRILFLLILRYLRRGKVARLPQNGAALYSELNILPLTSSFSSSSKLDKSSGSSFRSLKPMLRLMSSGIIARCGRYSLSMALKLRLRFFNDRNPFISSGKDRILLWEISMVCTAGSFFSISSRISFSEQFSSMRLVKYYRWSGLISTMRRQLISARMISLGCSNRSSFSKPNPSSRLMRIASSPRIRIFLILQGFLLCALSLRRLPGRGICMGSSMTLLRLRGRWSISVNWLYMAGSYTFQYTINAATKMKSHSISGPPSAAPLCWRSGTPTALPFRPPCHGSAIPAAALHAITVEKGPCCAAPILCLSSPQASDPVSAQASDRFCCRQSDLWLLAV